MIAEWGAVKVLLEAVPGLAGRIKDTAIEDDGKAVRGTYLVLFGAGPESLDDERYGAIPRPLSDAQYSFPVRAVSDDAAGVRLLADRVQSVVGVKPVIAERTVDPVTVVFNNVKADNSVSPPLYFMDMWVEFASRR